MKISDFWGRMNDTFGVDYASSVAADQSFGALEGRTVNEALKAGVDVKSIWMAVCAAYPDRVPARLMR
ncbi:DUF3046 domain-containing protein [Natronoglycomyces albus]|uniref:DUF3046 domain-containing protein n=1 Tax=Natronoglycomyces albus TaxID=2811108 RepID=A0A895XML1_9ACTN|nr:DUF3046 domain-containing protein [Natronoglycomyces albus]QSB06594.1 DUF3046 domain-containing protein [Natronoglycomyces albus]